MFEPLQPQPVPPEHAGVSPDPTSGSSIVACLAEVRTRVQGILDRSREAVLAWSASQWRTFDGCPRARYWASEVAPQGWRRHASSLATLAMRLKTLTSLDLAAGNEVHARASEYAAAIRDGEPRPALRLLRQRCSVSMRYVWTASLERYREWLRCPKQVPMLIERYYRRGPTLERGAQTRERMERALLALVDLGLWEELAACDPATIQMPDKRTQYTLPDPLSTEPVLVWAVPDLLFQLPDGGAWVVVDYKTGRVADSKARRQACDQVVGYAVYLRHGLRVLGPDDGCQGRLVLLSDGTEHEWWISADEITAAEGRIRQQARALAASRERADAAEGATVSEAVARAVSGDVLAGAVETARRGTYPMTPNRLSCRSCPYLELCAPEQAAENQQANADAEEVA